MSTNGFWRDVVKEEEKKSSIVEERQLVEEKEKPVKKEKVEKRKPIPSDYKLELKLSSAGKLSVPEVIHVRDYLIDDILRISKDPQNVLEPMLESLHDMIYEDVDPYLLHERELEELMLNIYANFWSPVIYGYDYRLMAVEDDLADYREFVLNRLTKNEELDLDEIGKQADKEVEDFKNGGKEHYVDISLVDAVTTKVIKKDFKEPIVVRDPETKEELIAVRLPRIGDTIIAKKYVEKKFAHHEQKFANYDQENATEEERTAYTEYEEEKQILFAKVVSALRILRSKGKELETLEEKLYAFDSDVFYAEWTAVNQNIEEAGIEEFGVDPEIKLISPFSGKSIKRRCHFRIMEFIPAYQQPITPKYDIGYGN